MALDAVITDERRDLMDLEKERFKSRMIAARPEHAKDIIEMFDSDGQTAGGKTTYEAPLHTGPLTANEINQAVRDLASFGISLRPVEP